MRNLGIAWKKRQTARAAHGGSRHFSPHRAPLENYGMRTDRAWEGMSTYDGQPPTEPSEHRAELLRLTTEGSTNKEVHRLFSTAGLRIGEIEELLRYEGLGFPA